MRRILAQLEWLAPARFILLIGLVGGAIQGVPHFFLSDSGAGSPRLVQIVVFGVTAVLWWTAALFLWWITVRRRRWSVWLTAVQVTLGLALVEILTIALTMVMTSIETSGSYAAAISRQPLMFITPNLALIVVRSPVWFLGSALAVALGRSLRGQQSPVRAAESAPAHSEAAAQRG